MKAVLMMIALICGEQVRAQVCDSVCTPEENVSNKYDQFFLEAMVQREKGNHDAAFDLLRHCMDLNPEAPEV